VDPSKKVPDLNCEVQDLLLEVVDLKQEVPDLRSGGIPLNLTPDLELCPRLLDWTDSTQLTDIQSNPMRTNGPVSLTTSHTN